MSDLDSWEDPDAEIDFGDDEDETTAAAGDGAAVIAALQVCGIDDVTLLGTVTGPQVTRYELRLPAGTRLQLLDGLERDLAYELAAKQVRIVAPLPGRKAIGIEITAQRGDEHAVDVGEPEPPKPHFANLGEFVDQYLVALYRRELGAARQEVRWCSEWWRHEEALARLDALWRSWELLRLEPGTGMSVWLLDHADRHMAVLLSEHGPFAKCKPADARRKEDAVHASLMPLPSAVPPDLFAPEEP